MTRWLEKRITELLSPPQGRRKPGRLGENIPYLSILRYFLITGMVFRFAFDRNPYPNDASKQVCMLLVFIMAIGEAFYLSFRPRTLEDPRIANVFIAIELVYISVAYVITGTLRSDFFLFYFLPIVTAADYGGRMTMRVTTAFVSCAYFAVLSFLAFRPEEEQSGWRLLAVVGNFFPRVLFLMGTAAITRFLILTEKNHYDEVLSRERMMTSLLQFGGKIEKIFDPDRIMELAAQAAVEDLGIHYCFIQTYYAGKSQTAMFGSLGPRSAYILPLSVGPPEQSGKFELRSHREFPSGAKDFVNLLWNRVWSALQRSQRIAIIREINAHTGSALNLNRHLNDILNHLIDDLKLEFATISLADHYLHRINCVRGRNVAPGWIRRSHHALSSNDVQCRVVNNGDVIELEGDEGLSQNIFEREIYDRFEHEKFARIWVPLRDEEDRIVGTIECGCLRENRRAVLTPQVKNKVIELGVTKGKDVAAAMPQVLLERIAKHASEIIGAQSASIHVLSAMGATDEENSILTPKELAGRFNFDKPLHAAGAGLADFEFMRAFLPRPDGIGWQAIHALIIGATQPYVVINKPDDLKGRNQNLYKKGVRSMAAFPLSVTPDVKGVLYVHFWHNPHEFSETDLELERVFASQVELTIKNFLLFDQIAVTIENSRGFAQWLQIVQAPAAGGSLGEVLEGLAQNVLLASDADNVVIYRFDQTKNEFESRPILKGKFYDEDSMKRQVEPDHLVRTLPLQNLPIFWKDVDEFDKLTQSNSRGLRFVVREKIKSSAALPLRAREQDEFIGIMFLNYREPQSFDPSSQRTLQALAQSAAIGIRTARYYDWIRRSQAEIDSLRELDTRIVENARTLKLEQILNSILEKCCALHSASVGGIFWRTDDHFHSIALHPMREECLTRRMDEGLVGTVGSVGDWAIVAVAPEHFPIDICSRSAIAVAIRDGSSVLGVLTLESVELNAYGENDLRWLQTLVLQAVLAYHTAESYRGLQKQLSHASAQAQVALAMQNPALSIDAILRIVLTGITAGSGLGFSRAMLFRADEGVTELTGQVAVGEVTADDAASRWSEIAPPGKDEDFRSLLIAASESTPIRSLENAIRRISLPMVSANSSIMRCIRDKHPAPIDTEDPFRSELIEKSGDVEHNAPLLCVPLLSHDRVLGVIVVDNRFLPPESATLDAETIISLTSFANLAAMGIDNFVLRKKDQIEAYRNWVHEIRSPLTLAKQVADNALAEIEPDNTARPYLEKLLALAQKTLRVGRSLRFFADMAQGKLPSCKPELATAASTIARAHHSVEQFQVLNAQMRFYVDESGFWLLDELEVLIDPRLLELSLDCLLDNAAKHGGRQAEVWIRGSKTEGGFTLSVANTGANLGAQDAARAREPHFRGIAAKQTTDEGGGIGLWIVDSIMRVHGGSFMLHPTSVNGITVADLVFLENGIVSD